MSDEKIVQGLREIYKVMARQTQLLEDIAAYLGMAQPCPDVKRPLQEYPSFDWGLLGATVEAADDYGASQVSWRGNIYTRRCPENKYKPAIWFSRCVGKDAAGQNKYEKLITFMDFEPAEPISRKVEQMLKSANGTKKLLP